LANTGLYGTVLREANLEGSDLQAAYLQTAYLADANFARSNLFLADLRQASGINTAKFDYAYMDPQLRAYIRSKGGRV
jgi:uncharacterized protein YjbI with pentapeptide repeats